MQLVDGVCDLIVGAVKVRRHTDAGTKAEVDKDLTTAQFAVTSRPFATSRMMVPPREGEDALGLTL